MPAKATGTNIPHETVEQSKPKRGPTPFIRVEVPALWPQACVVCQSAKGPLVDTTHDLGRQGGRIYVCSQCVKWAGLELGIVDGDRMDELLASSASLATAEQEIANLNAQVETMLADAAAGSRKAAALEELLQQARDGERERRHVVEQAHELLRQSLQAVS